MAPTWLRPRVVVLFAPLLVCLHAACGDDQPTSPTGASSQRFYVSISSTPGQFSLTPGRTKQLTALQMHPNGEHYGNCTTNATWKTSNPAIAVVSSFGEVTAIAPGTVVISATCSGVTGSTTLTVFEPASLSGTVSDPSGLRLAEASVYVSFGKYGTGASTDQNGRFRVTGLVRGSSYPVYVSKGGYETVSTTVTLPEAETTLNVTLEPGVSVSGRVTESDVGPLGGVKVEVIDGPNAGRSEVSRLVGSEFAAYTIEHLQPGRFTLRASKEGYEPVERTVDALVSTRADFSLKASYGFCLVSVSPVILERFASAGGEAAITVDANPERRWTAEPDAPWIEVPTGHSGIGPGKVLLRIQPAVAGATDDRAAMVRIGCGPTEGQNVRVSQLPDCQTTLAWASDSPTSFPAAGGLGRVLVKTGTPSCHWQASSRDDWIHTVGVNDWHGDLEAHFTVAPNTTGMARVGTVVIGVKPWEVRQSGQ
jgi:hypothetical protein